MPMKREYQKEEFSQNNFSIPDYVKGLLLTQGKKVCTNLSETLIKSHDSVMRCVESAIKSGSGTVESLRKIARKVFLKDGAYLLVDDTHISKQYAQQIEGLEESFDGSTGRTAPGIRIVTPSLTNDLLNIPLDAAIYFSKKLGLENYKTKTEIAISLILNIIGLAPIKRILADAHYSTKTMFNFLHEKTLPFLMKFARNRVVQIGKKKGQLRDLLRLKKNNHTAFAKGFFGDIELWFYAAKQSNGTVCYFVANEYIPKEELTKLYRMRWKIEIFYRTAKQYLGMGDCQMRGADKQRQHVLFVMHAYAIASLHRVSMDFENVESTLKHLRMLKPDSSLLSIIPLEENFDHVA